MLKYLREDAAQYATAPERSFLFRLLSGVPTPGGERYAVYQEAKNIFLGDPKSPHAIAVRLFFEPSRANSPTIHFDLPGEEEGENGIGVDEDADNALYVEGEDDEPGEVTAVYQRRYLANYNIVCTGSSPMQVLIIYNVVRAWLVAAYEHLALCGLQNPKLSGNDLIYRDGQMPANVFCRAIRLRTSYDLHVPALLASSVITQLLQNGPNN